jgi:hypothetical protein
MKHVRATFMACASCALVSALSAFAPLEATELDPIGACRGELSREAAHDGFSTALAEALISNAMRSHPDLSCTDYALMIQAASVSLRQYLQRPAGSRQSAHDAANAGRLDEAQAAYGQLGTPGQRIRIGDLRDAALLSMAASDFREAARLLELAFMSENLGVDDRLYYREMQAQALYYSGDLTGNAGDLETALAIYRELSLEVPRGDESRYGSRPRTSLVVAG